MKNVMKSVFGFGLSVMVALVPSLSSALARDSFGGGSDGGGNTYHGRPLESYAKDPLTLAAYQKLIAPLLEDLENKATNQNSLGILRNFLLSAFNQKNWYFVPGPLEHIPTDLLGSAVRTDQAVLQGFGRVWIDEGIWRSMRIEDQAKLLLHEAYMGLKILQFAGSARLCQAAYGISYDCSRYPQLDNNIALTMQDYINVQNMTIETAESYQAMTHDDWMTLIQKSNLKYPYDWFEKKIPLTPAGLAQLLVKSSVSGYLPTFGYNLRSFDTAHTPISTPQDLYQYFQKHKESCQIQAEVIGRDLHLKLSGQSDSFEQVIPLPEEIQTQYADPFKENRILQQVGIGHRVTQPRSTGGYTFYNLFLAFDDYRLVQVYFQEMVCMDQECNPYVDVKGGMLYVCSDNGHLYRP